MSVCATLKADFLFNNIQFSCLKMALSCAFHIDPTTPCTSPHFVNIIICVFNEYRWPEYFEVAESTTGKIMGYIMGKAEARHNNPQDWHGHVTAVSVADEFRRLGLAAKLMEFLEEVSESKKCYFVDLFVRVSNEVAVGMYKALKYVVFRTMKDYYSGPPDEDAYDMRKALSRDRDKRSELPPTEDELLALDDC